MEKRFIRNKKKAIYFGVLFVYMRDERFSILWQRREGLQEFPFVINREYHETQYIFC